MRLILEYYKFLESRFQADYKPIKLSIKGQSIFFNIEKSKEKDILIRSITDEIYPDLMGDDSININGFVVSGELINKAQKNIAILYEIVNIAKSIGHSVTTADDLIGFINSFKQELFSVGGEFFERIYNRLGGSTDKGKLSESKSNDLFMRYSNSKGIEVDLKEPELQQDKAGIDAYFEHKGRIYTIQTKTLSSINKEGDYYIVYISGDFTKIKTTYLTIIPENSSIGSYIFRGINVIRKTNERGISYYHIPMKNLLYKE
jgi:hypothetical protein